MADNTTLPGTGDSVRDIDKGGKKTQVVVLDLGGAGAESLLTTTLPVSGTVTANLSATDNAVLDAAVATLGATNGAAVITDADGTLQQYLRGIIKLAIDTTPTPVSETFPTADADLTQKITVATAGTPVQGPNKTSANGWLLSPASTNTGAAWYMFWGQTAANKGFPMPVGGLFFVPVSNLNSLGFDVTTSGNIIIASKA